MCGAHQHYPFVSAARTLWSLCRCGRCHLGNSRARGPRRSCQRVSVLTRTVPWAILAALFPLAMLVLIWLVHELWWGPIELKPAPLSTVSFILAVLIVGEEAGWRGFLLPYLLQRLAPMSSAWIVGLIWAVWHLPNFVLPDFPHYGLPFGAFLLMTLAFSVLFTWLHLKTAGSLLIATLFHAALNLSSLAGVEPSREYWLKAVVYGLVALAVSRVIPKNRRDKQSLP